MTDRSTVNGAAPPPPAPSASVAPLRNVQLMMGLVDTLMQRSANLPGLGVMHGYPSLGKTVAANYVRNKVGAHLVEVREFWTRKAFAQNLLHALHYPRPKGTVADMMDRAIRILGDDPTRPLIIDEADKLVDKNMVEMVRDLHETSGVPVIMVGEEKLPEKLTQFERTYDRVLEWATAVPCDEADARALAELIVPGLSIADDQLAEIVSRTDGRARRIVTTLERIKNRAAVRGAEQLTMELMEGAVAEGRLPKVRSVPPVRRAA